MLTSATQITADDERDTASHNGYAATYLCVFCYQ